MWLLTSIGFFSVVVVEDDPDRLMVRARRREHLEALCERHLRDRWIVEGVGTDYPFRVFAPRQDVEEAVAALVAELDYPNFKDAVAERQGVDRAQLYGTVWSTLRRLEEGNERLTTYRWPADARRPGPRCS